MARKRFTFFHFIQVLFLKPARPKWSRSLRFFTILLVAVLASFFAVNVNAQSAYNSVKIGAEKLQISGQKVDKFAVIAGILGISNQPPGPKQGEDLARRTYAAGELEEAAKYWEQAVAGFEVGGDWLNQAIALSNLSLTYQQLGRWEEANRAIAQSRNLLPHESRLNSPEELKAIAQILDIQYNGQWEQGQVYLALQTGKRATNIYVKLKDNLGWKRSLIAQIKALQELGLYQQACQAIIPVVESNNPENFVIPNQGCQQLITQKLEAIKEIVKTPSNPTNFKNIQITGARLLGDVLRQLGYLNESQELLQQVDGVITQQEYPQEKALVLLSLGDTYNFLGNRNKFLSEDDDNHKKYYQTARDLYEKAAKAAGNNSFMKVQAQLNLLSLLVDPQIGLAVDLKKSKELRLEILSQLSKLPPSRKIVYAEVSLMNSLVHVNSEQLKNANNVSNLSSVTSQKISNYCLRNYSIVAESVFENMQSVSWREIVELGAKAIKLARDLGDLRATAYALGNLGEVYEQNQQWLEAQQCTEQALLLSQDVKLNSPDLAYQWQWQLGRIRRDGEEKDIEGAIAAYTAAFNTLQSVRNDLVPISRDGQFDFRDRVEPVYRELADLLLQGEKPSQGNLKQARNVIEALSGG